MADTKELEKTEPAGSNAVDPRDEPSADWGWHGAFPNVVQGMGWAIAIVLLAMQFGAHKSNVENYWLIATALGIIGLLLWDVRKRRTAWRR